MSSEKDNSIDHYEDEISIFDIIKLLKDKWRSLVFITLVCSMIGLLWALLAPKKYEATAHIQMAMVGVSGKDESKTFPVEDPKIFIEKLKLPSFYTEKNYVDCDVTGSANPGADLVKYLKPSLNKNAPIISISYRSDSVEKAHKCVESVIDNIRISQQKLAQPLIDIKASELATLKDKLVVAEDLQAQFILSKKGQLKTAKEKLVDAEKLYSELSSKKMNFDFNDPKFSASTLLLNTLLNTESLIKDLQNQISELEVFLNSPNTPQSAEIKDLKNKINELTITLAEPQTKQASLFVPIHASDNPVEPKPILIITLSTVLGFMLALIWVFLSSSWERHRTGMQSS